jgi:uncharacterized repeat protein (TIGR01451 family)
MKKSCLFIFVFLLATTLQAQIVSIPDVNFKNALVNTNCTNTSSIYGTPNSDVDTNNDGEIQVSEAIVVTNLTIGSQSIASLVGIQSFSNLQRLTCAGNPLGTLNLTGLTNLQMVNCSSCMLTNITLDGLANLYSVECSNNLFASLDFSTTGGGDLNYSFNPNLVYVNMKNGVTSSCGVLLMGSNTCFMYNDCANLNIICMDENEVENFNYNLPNPNCILTSYCTYTPGGSYNNISGTVTFDGNTNGCDANDIKINQAKISLNVTGNQNFTTYSNELGNYSLYALENTATISPQLENATYFNVSPSNYNYTFTNSGTNQTANFCVTANGVHPDLEVTVIPITRARPGFDAYYKIIIHNKGTEVQSGTLLLTFNDAVLDFISATPAVNSQALNNLTWNFSNLNPFENKTFTFVLNVNSPLEIPAVNIGDILQFDTSIITTLTDETPANNTNHLNQTVMGSFDPNDKTVLEGSQISTLQAADFLHYIIRFQNSGTAAAENIVVKDMLSDKFDYNSLEIIDSSHPYRSTLTAGNKLEFFFENINLPNASANEMASHGYISFKIKPKNTVVLNDVISNTASIYFDYNAPIITNTTTTQVVLLKTDEFNNATNFTLFPNPAKNNLSVEFNDTTIGNTIFIYNALGQLIQNVSNSNLEKSVLIDISALQSGYYIVTILSEKGKSIGKFIKN